MDSILLRRLFGLDPELAHRLGFSAAWLADRIAPARLEKTFGFDDPIHHQKIWGLNFPNPIGLAAGCDKNALLVPFWHRLGFGHAEVGSVTVNRSSGNSRPRLFRLPEDRAIINRLGLPSKGSRRVAQRLSRCSAVTMPVGVSIARVEGSSSAIEDYCQCALRLLPYADYLTINISCPNTIDGKSFEVPEHLDSLLNALMDQVDSRVPVLVKLSPPDTPKVIYDSQTEALLETAVRHGVSGFVVTNTAKDRLELVTDKESLHAIGDGGLSGPPIYPRAVQMVRYVRSCVGPDYPIIGVGGISSAENAYQMIRAGASLLQIYTALVYEGPKLVQNIKRGLAQRLKSSGYTSIASAVGAAPGIGESANLAELPFSPGV